MARCLDVPGPSRPMVEIDKHSRSLLKGHSSHCLWLTGLSGAGKTTIATLLEERLHRLGRHTYLLDGDRLRGGLCSDLDYSPADRVEHIRRVGEVAHMMLDAGLIVIVALISPFRHERNQIRSSFALGEFIEIYLDTPLAICEARDAKGLYAKARRKEISDFTGISSPYEPPSNPEVTLHCGKQSPAEAIDALLAALCRLSVLAL